jgi:hypothetical protein
MNSTIRSAGRLPFRQKAATYPTPSDNNFCYCITCTLKFDPRPCQSISVTAIIGRDDCP